MKLLVTLSLALFTLTAMSQDYYWVGGSGNWSDFANHWATSSGGSTFHTTAPTSTDNVFFDANSFSGSGQLVTIDVEANCNSMDWTGVTNFPAINGNGNDLNIFGSLTLASDMTADFSDVEFESVSTGNTITSNGTELGSSSITRFQGIGGEWAFQDNFTSGDIYLSAGTLNTNGHEIDAGSRFQTSGADAKTINLGSSQITAERWWMLGTNQTISAGTSTIIVSSFYGDDTGDGPFTYYDVTFDNYGVLRNNATFHTITIPAGLELDLRSGDTFTVTGDLVATGDKHNPIVIEADTGGSEATFSKSSGSVTVSWVQMKDVHATGGATFTANDAIDNGNNTGWTINVVTGQDYYWVGDGGNWSDFANHWATTSGGSTMHTDYPNYLDNVHFDANSFTTTGQTVTQDVMGGVEFNNMNWTGVTNEPTLSTAYQHNLGAYGSVTFVTDMTRSIYGFDIRGETTGLTFDASGSGNITFLTFWGTGTYDLMSDISVSSFSHYNGTINYNDVSITCSIDYNIGNGSSSPGVNYGANVISCRDFEVSSSATPSVTIGTAEVTTSRDYKGHGIAMNKVIMNGNGTVMGSNTFEHFEVSPGFTVTLEAGETQTINQVLKLDGLKSSPINISSDDAGMQATISKTSGTIDAIYLVMQDLNATGGATFNATQTIDNGNNTGWNITGLVGADYYWVGDGGDWTDFANHWATTSGGSTMHTDEPGVLDNAIFDANSFTTASQTVTVNAGDISFHDITWTGVTNSPTFDSNGNAINVYGSFTFDPNMSIQLDDVNFLSTDPETITLQNDAPGTNSYFHFNSSGSWTFQSGFTVRELNHHSGSIDFNGQDVHIDFSYDVFGTDTKSATLGASNFFTRSFSIGSGENLTFDGSASTITSSSSFNILEFSGTNSFTFNDFKFIRYNSTDEGVLSADMTVNTLTFDAGTDIELRAGITITISDLVAVGTAQDPIKIYSLTQGSAATFSKSSGTIDAHYLELEDITATGGATFNAFSSLDNGNVTGWTFHRTAQTISFDAISDVTFGAAPFVLTATATSGLNVSFSIVSGPATVDGDQLTVTGAGTIQVRAEQAGDIDYEPAPSVINSFQSAKADQTITFDAIPVQLFSNGTMELTATGGGSTEPVVFTSSNTGVATVSGTTVTFVSEGTTTITASQAADENYNAAASVDQDLTISAGNLAQTITFGTPAPVTYGGDPFDLTGTASSGLALTYVSSDESVATISGSTVTILTIGTTTITASQGGDAVYNAATDVQQDLVVDKATLTATADDQQKVYGDANPTFTVTYSGFVNGEDETALNTEPTFTANITAATDAGAHAITMAGGSADNYDLSLVDGVMTIDKRPVTATADDIFIREGDAIPTLTISYSDLVNGDTGSDIDIPPAVATTATSTSAIGDYPITLAGGEDNNYLISTLVDGTLTIAVALAVDEVSDVIRMYPNPVTDYVVVESPEAKEYQLEIRSLEGKLIQTYVVKSEERVDLRKQAAGTYLVVLKENGAIRAASRLIVE